MTADNPSIPGALSYVHSIALKVLYFPTTSSALPSEMLIEDFNGVILNSFKSSDEVDDDDDLSITPFLQSLSSDNKLTIGFNKRVRKPPTLQFGHVALKKRAYRDLHEVTFYSSKQSKFAETYDVYRPIEVELYSSEDDEAAPIQI